MSSPGLVWGSCDHQGLRLLLSFYSTVLSSRTLTCWSKMAAQALAFTSTFEPGERRAEEKKGLCLPLNTLLGSHALHFCSHPVDLNLVTYPYLAARKDLGKVDFISFKNCVYFHGRRNGKQILRDNWNLFCTYTCWNKFEIKSFSFTKEASLKFFYIHFFLVGEMCIKMINGGTTC